ncbi:hypothetical protein P5F11_12960 [Clostridium perfringens]|nr:hypothetical protein [Clostridium perfringens]
MGESFKDKVLDKILDEFLSFVMGKSKDELIEIIFKDDARKTLYRVMKDFSKTDHFKYGFSKYSFLDEYKEMNKFNEEMFNIALNFDELKENIKKVIGIYFVSDINDKTNELIEIISNKFFEKVSLKENLADLLIKQENIYMETKEQLDKQITLLNEIKNQKYDEEKYKQDLMKNELNMIIRPYLNDIADRYIFFVVKKAYPFPENATFITVLNEIVEKIENYINIDFFKKPIKAYYLVESEIMERLSRGEEPIEQIIPYKNFAFYELKVPIIKNIDYLNSQYSNKLTDSFLKNLLKLKVQIESPFLYTGLEYGVFIDIENAEFNIDELREFLKNIGLIIIALYEEIEG